MKLRRFNDFFKTPDGRNFLCTVLFAVTVLVFWRALSCDFQFYDEKDYLLDNPNVSSGLNWSNLAWAFVPNKANWYPLTWISHMLDFEMFGRQAWGHHLTNVLFHSANGVLLFLILRRMTGALWRSFIVSALFAVHPLRVESVAWISERKDILSAFFGLLALWTYVRFVEESRKQNGRTKYFYGLLLLFFACSLMSKAMLVTFPFVLLLLDYWPFRRLGVQGSKLEIGKLIVEKIPLFLLIVPVSVVACVAQKNGGQFVLHVPLGMRIETAIINYLLYFLKMLWPVNLSVLYPYPYSWPMGVLLSAIIFVLGISGIAFAIRKAHPCFLTGWLWYLGTLVPVVGFIPLGAQSMANHYTYFPMIGILFAVVWLIGDLWKRFPQRAVVVLPAVTLAVFALCTIRTCAEINYWKDSTTLWTRAIAVTKDNWMAHCCLGNILSPGDSGLEEFQKSTAINPDYAESQRGLAVLLMMRNRFSDAIGPLQKAVVLEPQNGWAYNGLGYCYLATGQGTKAVQVVLKAVEIEPQNSNYLDDLARTVYASDSPQQTISNFLQTAQNDPEAFKKFLQAVDMDTKHAEFFYNLAWNFATYSDAKLRNGNDAISLARRACEITGYRTAPCLIALAAGYAEAGQFDMAISTGEKAVTLAEQNGQTNFLKKAHELSKMFHNHQAYHESSPARQKADE